MPSLDQLDTWFSAAAGVLAALLVVGHALEAVVKLTPTPADDAALAKVMNVLNSLVSILPRLKFGKITPALALALAFWLSACGASGPQAALADVKQNLPRAEASLRAAQDAYEVVCVPPVAGAEKFCADAKQALDTARQAFVVVSATVSTTVGE